MTRQEAIGLRLLELRPFTDDMSTAADLVETEHFSPNRKDESIGTQTAEAYKEELKRNPDKHAQEMLRAIERGEKLEEDPSGS